MSAEVGECRMTSWTEHATMEHRLRIDQADPVVRVCAEMLQEISIATERGETTRAKLVEDVLTLRGDNRTVVYRIDYTDWDAATDTYRAEWPD